MRTILRLWVLLCLTSVLPHLAAQGSTPGIVISQIYGGGGNAGATLRNDFIELFNRSSAPIAVTGWSVQYASATGSTWDRTNALTPLDGFQGQATVIVTNGTRVSASFTAVMRAAAPSLLLFGASKYVVATHADGSLLGPASMSVPGYTFTPAAPGETIVMYGVGFGLPTTPLVEGSALQDGLPPIPPVIQIGAGTAVVQYAGVISPGLYQFNVVVPPTVSDGDNAVIGSFGGFDTPAGALFAVQR